MTTTRLLVRPLLAVALVLGFLVVGPGSAGACACGAVLTDGLLQPAEETALVELTGRTESITLTIGTEAGTGSAVTRAAFVMPVPSRAGFTLADGRLFGELDRFSRPRVEYREVVGDGDGVGGSAPDARGGVTVTDHVEVGPYEVAQLTGADATAVSGWLADNDFTLSPELAGALTPYLAEGWLVVAVRLAPSAATGSFADGLPSMRLTFETDEPVYPMRLSATAERNQPLRLYVLADHRMDVTGPAPTGADPELSFAGWVAPADLADYPLLAELVDERRFLTRYDGEFAPTKITADMYLTRAASNETYRTTVFRTRYVDGVPWGEVVLVGLGVLAVAGAGVLGVVILLRRRRV